MEPSIERFAVGRITDVEFKTQRYLNAMAWISDPDEVLRRAGIRREHLRQLEGDDEISGACDTRLEAVVATPWRLEPAEGAASEFVWEQLSPHIEALIRGVWGAVPYGYSVVQIVYAPVGGRIGIAHVIEEPFEEFIPTHLGQLLTYDGRTLEEQGIDPRRLLLTVRQPTRLNPYGRALFSRLYWPWFFRSHGWRFWMKWLERFGSPFLVGSTKGDVKAMGEMLAQAVNAASVALAEGDTVETVEQKQGTGHFESFEGIITRRIQKLILGQTLTTDVQDKGSFAAAKVHNEVREDKRNADIRMCSGTIQKLVNYLWELNRFGGLPPKFVMADDTGLETERAARDAILSEKMGVKFTDEYLIDRYDLEPGDFTRKEEPDMTKDPASDQEEKPEDKGGGKFEASYYPPLTFAAGQGAIDSAFDRLLSDAPGGVVDMKDIRSAVMAAADAQDLEKRLAMLLGRDNPEFAKILSHAMFSAHVLGFVTA